MKIEEVLKERILVLDGAMGTMIQKYHLTEDDYRGERFKHLPGQLKGNNDALCITRPDVIEALHRQYLEAGADIITANTFGANRISQSDYGMEDCVRELNIAAVHLVRKLADEFTQANPNKPRWVAGSISPTNKTASISPDVSNPAYRAVTFDELYATYREQIEALIEGGVDILLFETAFDTLNVKAGLMAAEDLICATGKQLPIMLSFTIGDKSGRILSGQTIEAAVSSVAHVKLMSIGMNCSFGAKDMQPFLKQLRKIAPAYVSAHPNAGLPNSLGNYDETPETMALQIREFLNEGLVNIIGGCCGTTPAHIASIAAEVEQAKGKRPKPEKIKELVLSGLEPLSSFNLHPSPFVLIGERCNVAGSRKFLRLIKEKNYEEALDIARKQVEDGAQILDVNVDDGLLDGVHEITTFLNLIASEPDIARVPVMLDSSDWNILEAGLKCLQGKSIVNSISLKNGEADFLEKARKIKAFGAAVIAMAFDEKGQADTYERKIEVCERMYRLLTEKVGFPPHDIIFDPNVLAIATGIEEHNGYAVNFIRAVEWIKKHLPCAKVSGGVSNLSFSFRGNNYLREAMHAVFLYHAIAKGMDMGIVNPSAQVLYEDVPKDLLQLLEDTIFNRTPDAAEKLLEYAQSHNDEAKNIDANGKNSALAWRKLPLEERLQQALIKGISEYLEDDLQEALKVYPSPIDIIDKPLMGGLNIVGNLFGEGKMFLPQVVKSARTMKKAVALLQPYIELNKKSDVKKAGKILFATVKGDVHDIGKNITGVVLSCNNYEVIDIGVMTPPEMIIEQAQRLQPDIVALSGLITPSLQEMAFVASEMERAGLTMPLLIGGATTSKLHTALKIAPLYSGTVVQVSDASRAVPAVNALLNPQTKGNFVEEIENEHRRLREKAEGKTTELVSLTYARQHPFTIDWSSYTPPKPSFFGSKIVENISLENIIPCINWAFFLAAWKLPPRYASLINSENISAEIKDSEKEKFSQAQSLIADAKTILAEWADSHASMIQGIIGFYPVQRDGDNLIVQSAKGDVPQKTWTIPFLRQQEKRDDERYKSLADFVSPNGDYIGMFIVTAGQESEHCACGVRHEQDDDYRNMLEQTLRDRLAEAGAEYLHQQVRTKYWGYAPDESLSPTELLKETYRGIRPASGYPSCPDLSLNFLLDKLLKPERIGVHFTPNGAIVPLASTAGFYFAHPESVYFNIGKIDGEQLRDYAVRKGITEAEAQKWIGK